MKYRELSNEQRRQWLDFMQVDEAYRSCEIELQTKCNGSMRWLTRGAKDYLHIKRGRTEKSLGVRSSRTSDIYQKFMTRRVELKERHVALSQRLAEMAPVNRALGLGRIPTITAKILRKLYDKGLLGKDLLVAGTNALWVYEAKAGVQFQSELVATNDADLLWDPRHQLKLFQLSGLPRGILGLLEDVDSTFKKRSARDFKAMNKNGFSVDLLRPEDLQFFKENRQRVTDFTDDLNGAPIFGLHWLLNSPRMSAYCIAEDGFSVFVPTFDPRSFALHKIWISMRTDRDPLKTSRDRDQAKFVAEIATKYLGLTFNDEDLRALPSKLRTLL